MPTTPAKETRSTVIPSIRYRDAQAAIDWLSKAFGFELQAVYHGPDNTIAHAQLSFGNGMVMLGSASNAGPADPHPLASPEETGNRCTQSNCLVVTDCDAVYEMAKSAGAKILMQIADMDYGGRAFSCLDLEGHIWHVGSYDPWAA